MVVESRNGLRRHSDGRRSERLKSELHPNIKTKPGCTRVGVLIHPLMMHQNRSWGRLTSSVAQGASSPGARGVPPRPRVARDSAPSRTFTKDLGYLPTNERSTGSIRLLWFWRLALPQRLDMKPPSGVGTGRKPR